jgi:hypothetical protein
MIGKLLASGQLGKLASFVSPAFFDVMPAAALWSRAKQLFARSRDQAAFRHAVAARSAALRAKMPQLRLTEANARATSSADAPAFDAAARAALVTELFFRQLFEPGPTLLDLRASAFSSDASGLNWHPATWVADWSADFIEPLRKIYRGFYSRDDEMFRAGLSALALTHSADLFREQFGGEQAQLRFRTADFVSTFHQVFLRCKQHRTALHPDFLPLGIYLAALYDHLEELNVPVDVTAAFERATLAETVSIHA